MKRFKIMMAAAMVMAAPALLTGCDDDPWDDGWRYEDQWWYGYDNGGNGWNDDYWSNGGDNGSQGGTVLDEAEVLEGEWDGTMAYTNGDNGEVSQFYANMTFVRNNSQATKGTGTEVDYTTDGSGEVDAQQTLKFNWYIDESTGDIHIHYIKSGMSYVMDASASQHGFSLVEDESFEGYMIGTNNKDMAYINLRPVQNNEAKRATRSATARSFGSTGIEKLKGGVERLTTRR